MDIARLGVVIDPTPAEQGATRVKQALKGMGDSAAQEARKTEQSTRATGETVKKLGTEVERTGTKAKGGFEKLSQAAAKAGQDTRGAFMNALDSMGLMDGRIGNLLRRADSMFRTFQTAKGLASPMREAAGAADDLAGGMGKAAGAGGALRGALPAIAVGLGAIAAAAVLATTAIFGIWKAFQAGLPAAAKFEQYRARIAFSMGSWSGGNEMFARLKKFAAETPFSDDDVFSAGTQLQTMTKGVLATDEALKAIGGSAAQAGVSFKEMAENAAVVFNGLQNGGDVIEYLKTMMNKGVIDGATLQQVRKLGEEAEKAGNKQANAAKQWALVYADLQRNAGALEIQSKTWDGMMATVEGNWDSVKAAFSAPIMDALKPLLQDIIQLLGALEPMARAAGEAIAGTAKGIYAIFKSGELYNLIVTAITDAFMAIPALWSRLVMAMGIYLYNNLTKVLTAIFSPTFMMKFSMNLAETMAKGLVEAVQKMSQAMMEMAEEFIFAIQDGFAKWWNSNVATFSAFGQSPFSPMEEPYPFKEAKPYVSPEEKAAQEASPDVSFLDAWGMAGEYSPDAFARTKELLDAGAADFDANYAMQMPDLRPPPGPESVDPLAGMGAGATADKLKEQNERIKETKTELASLAEEWTNLERGADQALSGITQSISGGLTDAITSVIMGTKSWGDAFREVGNMILESIIRMITQMWVQYTVGLMLQSVMGWAGVGTAAASGAAGAAAGAAGAVLHGGGTIGESNTMRSAGAALRLHGGGMASSEQPAILEKGETVLTRQQTEGIRRSLREPTGKDAGAESQALTIVNVTDKNEILDVIARNPEAILNVISRQAPKVRAALGKGGR